MLVRVTVPRTPSCPEFTAEFEFLKGRCTKADERLIAANDRLVGTDDKLKSWVGASMHWIYGRLRFCGWEAVIVPEKPKAPPPKPKQLGLALD